ncbi:MAG: T9SS type A sorting domain-containing protein [Flavobacterium sp.]|jgi:hypothetical protein|nr:T9SS type A sorting domain-containing protein [Flavobacterium sp.]
MKKIVLFLILFAQLGWSQTPIAMFEFNGNLNSSNGSNTLNTNSGYSGTVSYTNDRFGQANSACVLPTNVTANLSTVLTNLPQGNSNRTVSVWVKNINYPNTARINVFEYGNSNANQQFSLSHEGVSFNRLFVNNGVSSYTSDNNKAAIYPGGWYHYVVTHENSTLKIYVNGLLVLSQSNITLGTSGNTFSLNFGATPFANSQLHYDDLEIYDVALTETQIQNKYTVETPLNSNQLVAYFGFNNSLIAQNNSSLEFTTSNATPYTTGFNGQGLDFQLSTPASMPFQPSQLNNNNFTISFWNKRSGNPTFTFETMFEAFGALYFRDGTANASTRTNFGFNFGGSNWQNVEINRWTNNEWVHYAATFEPTSGNATIVKWYRNGILIYEQNIGSGVLNQSFENFITLGGGLTGNGSGTFLASKNASNMQLDELYIYNRALTQAQIMALRYQVPFSCPSGNVTLTTQAEVDALASCTSISGNLTINGGGNSLNLAPLNNITSITGTLFITGLSNNQVNIFPNLTTVGNGIAIQNNTFQQFGGLNAFTTLTAGNIQFIGNSQLTTISGFGSLNSLTSGNLAFATNTNLETVNAFSNLQTVNGLLIRNTKLTNLNFLSSLQTNNGQLSIESNSLLTNATFPNIVNHNFSNGTTGARYIRFINNTFLTTIGNINFNGSSTCEALTINGSLINSISSFGTSSFSVNGEVFIANNSVTNLNFLNQLTSCGGIRISQCAQITSLTGLANLTTINGQASNAGLTIFNNINLTTLNGLNTTNLALTNQQVVINGNTALTNISALSSIPVSGVSTLTISSNGQLTTCASTWLCDYVATGKPLTITGNATGCESVAVVNAACEALSTSDFNLAAVSLFPNPTDAIFSIEIPNEVVKQVRIFDVTGKMLLDSNQSTVNVSALLAGVYMVNIETESGKIGVSKLIKK